MHQVQATSAAQVRLHIAALRGLYGDIAENLHDPDMCNDLWAQVDDEQAQLDALVRRVDVPV